MSDLRGGPHLGQRSGGSPGGRGLFSGPYDNLDRRDPVGGTISTLTSKQRAHLRGLAHHLKPLAQIGMEGVTDAVTTSIAEAFNTRELLKVKVLDNAPGDVRETAAAVAEGLEGVQVVQTIGKTIVLYRPDPENPEIRLP